MAFFWFFLLININYALSANLRCEISETLYYDAFYGTLLSDEDYQLRIENDTDSFCVTKLQEACNSDGYRTIDGTCNNLNHPTRGAGKTPFVRMLPAVYNNVEPTGFEPRLAKNGSALPLAREIRTKLLAEGKVPDQDFTTLISNILVFMTSDVVIEDDTVKYVINTTYCCEPEGAEDPMCVPNEIPEDDPVHRYSGNRCINMTRPINYQVQGCLSNDTTPERFNRGTPLPDLSLLYGTFLEDHDSKGRLFSGGLLQSDVDEKGRIWPPNGGVGCLLNREDLNETRCHNTPEAAMNGLFGINLSGIWLWRYHNLIANELAALNTCWDDEKIFQKARDILIALYNQILYHELFSTLMGYDNLVNAGVISSSDSFRDIYDENAYPEESLEFLVALRWIHTLQEGTLKLITEEGVEYGEIPVVNLTRRTGYLSLENNIEYLTQGSFRQAGGKIDYVVDPDISNRGFGGLQKVLDITTNDLAKNRYFGFYPYVDYLQYCNNATFASFDDLLAVMSEERIELLQQAYEDVTDIDLMAGIWSENLIEGGSVPTTFFCIIADQLKRNVVSDRHWYERAERPQAFTEDQLMQIRNASMARLLCDTGDSVSEVQPNAFRRISDDNPLTSCDDIPSIDLTAWQEETCSTD